MWPGPGSRHSSRARFQCTTCQPPVPSPSSTAVVLTTTRSPTPTVPVRCDSTYARSGPARRSTSTRWRPVRSSSSRTTWPERSGGIARASERRDEPFDALVARLERVLAEHRSLCLVVQLQVHPVDRVVALALLRALDERTSKPRPRGLWRCAHGLVDRLVRRRAIHL